MHPVQIVFLLICLTLLAFGLLKLAEYVAVGVQKRQRFSRVRSEVLPLRTQPPAPVPAADTSINTDMNAQSVMPPLPDSTEREWVIALARRQKVDGSWRHSANAIYDLVKGNRNEVMGWIREAREETRPEPAAVTPFAGRPYNPKAYQDDPELAYNAPPQ